MDDNLTMRQVEEKGGGYHIIGDIHGHADKLEGLLQHLGYRLEEGCFQHPTARVVFLGDFIDRGPDQKRVIEIVRPMVESGNAFAIMGNHEFNAICYHTWHSESMSYLRPHNNGNNKQHREFLREYPLHDEETRSVIDWFKTLPLYLEVQDPASDGVLFRTIHACWNQGIIDGTNHLLTDDDIVEAATKGTPAYEDIEVLLKGPEAPLPEGISFSDNDGKTHTNIRTKWWSSFDDSTYRDVAMVPKGEEVLIPDISMLGVENNHFYDENEPPVFIGHYWLTGYPEMLTSNVACMDYSAGKGGRLLAYHWNAGTEKKGLSRDAFVHAYER